MPQAAAEESGGNEMTSLANLPPPIGAKANVVVSSFDDDAWGDADDWDFDQLDNEPKEAPKALPEPVKEVKIPQAAPIMDDDQFPNLDDDFDNFGENIPDIDINSYEYKNRNLNKLSDFELAKEKKAMDNKFNQNFVKPGDPNFVYDKVVDFSKVRKSKEWNDDEDYSDDWDDE